MGFACLFSLLLVFDWVALMVLSQMGRLDFFGLIFGLNMYV